MSKKNVCELYPKVTTPKGEVASRMYKDLLKEDGLKYPRPVANMLYAAYLTSNVEAQMEAATNPDGSLKYRKNSQGQFNARDYVEFIDFDKAIGEYSSQAVEEYRIGATNAVGGNRVDFTNAEDALQRAENFNNTHKGLVAAVEEHSTSTGTVYNILTYKKDSKNLDLPSLTSEKLKAWQIYKQVFNNVGVDITSMPTELNNIFSAYNTGLANHLKNLSMLSYDNMYRKDAMILFYIDKDSAEVQRVINSFGSIEDAATAVDDINHGYVTVTSAQIHLLKNAINHAQQLHGVDIDALQTQINQMQANVKVASPEIAIKHEIERLHKKYGIEKNEINIFKKEIKALSDASSNAAVQLKRRIDELYKQRGTSAEGKRLGLIHSRLMTELSCKHYYSGLLDYLGEAAKGIQAIDNILSNLPQNGTEKERIFKTMQCLQDIKRIKDQYLSIVTALASDNITIDESINQLDIDNIKQQAKAIKEFFEKKDSIINELTSKIVHDFMKLATNGKVNESELSNIMKKVVKEANWGDKWLYSMGTANNIFIASAGTIMRNQELERDRRVKDYRLRIDRATHKLYEAGYNTKFMFEDERHIASNIDWATYENVRKAKINSFKKAGLKGFDLKQAIENWEEQNTEDKVVDPTYGNSGRTERIPNQTYRKINDFQEGWSQEQIDYYDTVMQIKGELESLYPAEAQNYYLPPQVRRNTVDALSEAKDAKDVGKALRNKAKDFFVIREDDTDYAKNGIIGGEETQFASGNYDDTVKKEVPIFFQNYVESGELMQDFSAGLLKVASSAINYDAMMSIRDTMEALRDYVGEKPTATPKNKAELVDNAMVRVTKELHQWGKKNNVAEIMNGFIDSHIYGIKRDDQGHPKWAKLVDNIIAYTSFRGLSTNVPGAVANATMGIMQLFVDAGCGEFFGWKDLGWSMKVLFGDAGVSGDIMNIFTNDTSHKSVLLRDMFDPMQENYENDRSKRYHSSIFRKLISHDCSFIGYEAGEYLIHMAPMFAMLHKEKVLLNGKKISLYDAFEVTPKQDGSSELVVKTGVTDLNGNPITQDFIDKVKGKIRYANQTMHGAMNSEDKGLIHRYMAGRLVMNFRQWMVGHYSRRFRGKHFDFSVGDWREGYWVSVYKGLFNEDTKDEWHNNGYKGKLNAIGMFMKDLVNFSFRSSAQWSNLTPMQKYNVKRCRTELLMFLSLLGFSFALGDPDRHKKKWWRRFLMYQVRRMITETEASTPGLQMISSGTTILNSPMAGVATLNSILYLANGLYNGDLFKTIKSGKHKGENKYWRNLEKYVFPFYKDIERLQTLDEDESLFKVFESTPRNN